MERPTIPVTSIKTGVTKEERSFDWEISNFPVVLKHSAMVNSQRFDFYAGESIGMGSKWEACLQAAELEGRIWAGIFIALRERPKHVSTSEHLCVQFIFTFKTKDGVVKKTLDSNILDFDDSADKPSDDNAVGFKKLFSVKGPLPAYMELTDEDSLVIHVTFRIFRSAAKVALQTLGVRLEEFEVKSKVKARDALLPMPMGAPVLSSPVKVIANDQVEFWMGKEILSGRSPVFRAMLEADMTEGNSGVVEIQDMGSKSLKTMLHYMSRGELLPEWKSTEVIVELTNAAAKYELSDLLNFLDGVLGDVCNLENVGKLIMLAGQLSLKTAETKLMCYLRREGANSPQNFRQVLNAVLTSESLSGGASAASTGTSADDEIGGRRPSSSCSCSCPCCRPCLGKRSGDQMEVDNEAEKSKGKPPKKTRRERSQN